MKTNQLQKNNISIITLGCSKNIVDSENLGSKLKSANMNVLHADSGDKNQTIIINTCGFIDKAKEESINTILEYANARKNGNISGLYVVGCLIERFKDELIDEIKDVDGWYNFSEMQDLLRDVGVDLKKDLIGDRDLSTPGHYAYMKISEGCDRSCSFCAIPIIRGRQVSFPMESLVDEAVSLVKKGIKELILVAQELTSYGADKYGSQKLPELVKRLSDINGLEWIRLHYAYPARFPLELLHVIRERDNVCNYLDIPLQHASNHMLKMMNRHITKEKLCELIRVIRDQVPGIYLRTTMLVGFPGESAKDFDELCNFISEYKFDRLGVFEYSHEKGTKAFGLKNDIPEKIKLERAQHVMNLQQDISLTVNQNKIGETLEKVIIDREEGDFLIGRSEYDSPEIDNEVIITDNKNNTHIGEFVKVLINDASEFDLYGSIV